MVPEPLLVDRFKRELDALIAPDERIGIAVSGGADSLALLLLSAAARPGRIEVATVDHALRPSSRNEAQIVAAISAALKVPHAILSADWTKVPRSAIQERARAERYRLLGQWANERRLKAVATAHHLNDQAETVLMRLSRGAGVRGLSSIRPLSTMAGTTIALLRPLLGWSHAELEEVCAAARVNPINDPSNDDAQFERVRVRRALAQIDGLDAKALAQSAANLADADDALEWATVGEWKGSVTSQSGKITYRPSDAPREIQRRIASRAITSLASEGCERELRGREIDRLIATLAAGGQATLRGVRCSGGIEWQFAVAPPRAGRSDRTKP